MGRIVVITGAGAGVGRAAATEFARNGCDVALLSRDVTRLEHAAQELRAFGVRALPISTDVADAEASAAERVERELGPIDVWVNVAMATVFAPVHELIAEEFQRGTAVTYLGQVHGTTHLSAGGAGARHLFRRFQSPAPNLGAVSDDQGNSGEPNCAWPDRSISGALRLLRAIDGSTFRSRGARQSVRTRGWRLCSPRPFRRPLANGQLGDVHQPSSRCRLGVFVSRDCLGPARNGEAAQQVLFHSVPNLDRARALKLKGG